MSVLSYLQLIDVGGLGCLFPVVLRWFEKRGVGMSCYLFKWLDALSDVSQLPPSQPSFYRLPFSLDILIELLLLLMRASRFLGLVSKLKECIQIAH